MTPGSDANRLANPRQACITSETKPIVIPMICGKVRFRPKLAPDAASIKLFGPRVNAAIMAKMINPNREAVSIISVYSSARIVQYRIIHAK